MENTLFKTRRPATLRERVTARRTRRSNGFLSLFDLGCGGLRGGSSMRARNPKLAGCRKRAGGRSAAAVPAGAFEARAARGATF